MRYDGSSRPVRSEGCHVSDRAADARCSYDQRPAMQQDLKERRGILGRLEGIA